MEDYDKPNRPQQTKQENKNAASRSIPYHHHYHHPDERRDRGVTEAYRSKVQAAVAAGFHTVRILAGVREWCVIGAEATRLAHVAAWSDARVGNRILGGGGVGLAMRLAADTMMIERAPHRYVFFFLQECR
jgi:hypothetical protein